MPRLITATRDIDVRPDDVLVLESTADRPMTVQSADLIKKHVRDALGCHAIVLDGLRIADVVDEPGTPIYDAVMATIGEGAA